MIEGYILVLIYSGLVIITEPSASLSKCLAEAPSRIGEEAHVTGWDNMGGSNPIPKVEVAFCVQGVSAK